MDEAQLESSTAVAELEIDASLITKLNLADFQNAVPLIRELRLVNETERVYGHLELVLTSEPAFLKPRRWHIDALAAHSRCSIRDLDLKLDGGLLARLTEAEVATVSLTLRTADADAQIPALAQREFSLELLPRNQWGGLSHLPDLVAAFVQPNDPMVDRLLKKAAEILRQNDRNPALDGYAGGAQRAWELAAALWGAVTSLQLDYALPPASFEQSGQKVRSPNQIEASRLGTCFDFALLFCAALEQAGLNPLLIFTEGHAFAGLWLKREEFSTTVVDDITALRKRIKLKELVLFETTLITQRPMVAFSRAVEQGTRQVGEDQDAAFRLAVDIRRARLQRIKPLANADAPTPTKEAGGDSHAPANPIIEDAPDLPDDARPNESEASQLDPKDRLIRWQRKLLDLSLRNNLLSFKAGKKAIRLEAPDPGAVEDLLAGGQALKLLPRPDLMDGADPRDQAIYEAREQEDVRRVHALDALQRREVFVSVPEAELDARLVELFRSARTTMQEGGANTLYLALGFLSWTREDRDGQRYRAPLILVPVSLQRKNARSGFTLSLHEDEPRFNPTLIEMLRQDFALNLGVVESELPRDESGLDVAAIWKTVSHAIKDIKGWEVTEDVVLSMFSFAKYLMWKDLAEHSEQLRENSVVRHLLDTPREPYPSGAPFPLVRELDRQFGPEQVFCPLPADSSQLSAVLAASKGKDFVLIGPPGTGKSQTIANLIAQSLAEGRRVLFVSEKIAALDVVYRRLREVGLGEFCLELHSNKARKLDVLAQLQSAWASSGQTDPEQWRVEAEKLKRLRDALNDYVDRLHQRHRNGMSLFDAIGVVSAGKDVVPLALVWSSPDQHDRESMEQLRSATDRLEVNFPAIGHVALEQHPLALVGHDDWSPTWQQTLIAAAREVIPAAQAVLESAQTFAQAIGLPISTLTPDTCEALVSLGQSLPLASGHDWRFVLRPDARSVSQRLQQGAALVRRHAELNAQLSTPWPASVMTICADGLAALAEYQHTFAQLGEPWPMRTIVQLNLGLGLLAKLAEHHAALSVSYSEKIEQLDVAHLQKAWELAEQTFWPKSWLGKRRVKEQLSGAITSGAQPDVANDLQQWNAIRALREQIRQVAPGLESAAVWSGLQTEETKVRTALRWQVALAAVHEDKPWNDEGFDAVASGECGPALQADLQRARRLRQLNQDIAAKSSLETATEGLWIGRATQVDRLHAALDFLADRPAHSHQGALDAPHTLVEEGMCGQALAQDHKLLQHRIEIEQELVSLDDLRETTAGLWKGLATNLDELVQACQFQTDLATILARLANTPEQIAACMAPLHTLLGDANALLEPNGRIALAGTQHMESWKQLLPRRAALAGAGHFDENSLAHWLSLSISALIESSRTIMQSEHGLRGWCAWRQARAQALALGLNPLVKAIEQGQIDVGQTRRAFETNYARWWLNAVVDREPVIRGFVSAEHEKRIRDFHELDERFTALTRDWLRARLCADLPSHDNVSRNSEWGVLRHEISKKRAHLPLRELMAQIPSALTKLTPCLLMSPLSIAQYLQAGANAFDLVIFDEASQIPVWDAIGAIARGRQVVMVGDPKQLPPTSFFDRAESGQDDEDVEADLESILDECIGANLPTRNLNWHYRSRHESLIAFSNHAYYNGELVTFPSPVTDDRAVSLQTVTGTYQKGSSRTNQAEAKALVADVVARLTASGFREGKLTIGVVTFNAEQQKLIEDLLDEARRQDPRLESYFADSELEPLFVKNLESVQGDERDIIYFSITYGPDPAGQLAMNFGPLNRQGGERRLNVAITRARHELRVFTSFKAEQMDLTKTQSIGVRDLKHFLEFAERGARALAEISTGSLGGFESPFEQAVATALAQRGWRLQPQIGASSFRVDLGVVDPDAPGRYLAGVECDGATYHRSATARDRDKLREQVLRGLGWEIVRIWSTDWWIDSTGTLDKLDAKLHALLATQRARRLEQTEREAEAERLAQAAIDKAIAGATRPSVPGTNIDAGLTSAVLPISDHPEEAEEVFARPISVSPVRQDGVNLAPATSQIYQVSNPADAITSVEPDRFFETEYTGTLLALIAHVVKHEGPLLDAVLARRIARAHGWLRTGGRISERVLQLARSRYKTTAEDVGVFYWPEHLDPAAEPPFRAPADGDSVRPADEICMPELASLARTIIAGGFQGEVVCHAMARELGLQQLRAASRSRFERVLKSL